jgi:membrane fusion protein (multidrug efflux system)
VIPRVAGIVDALLVQDNDRVKAGQPLLQLQTHDLDVKISGAEAALAQAQANLESMRANAIVAQANVTADQVAVNQERRDLERNEQLFRTGTIAEETVETARMDAEAAVAKHAALQRQAEAASAQIALATAAIAQRQSELDFAKLQRSYATITSPIDGVVSRRSVEIGQYVQAGQPLMAITGASGFWVVANFKETQLESMRPGQPAVVRLDAYPGVKFQGQVDSIAGATGARFALLPPDNATGNFVKVTQRVPVKITVADGHNSGSPLRLGLSAYATVKVR